MRIFFIVSILAFLVVGCQDAKKPTKKANTTKTTTSPSAQTEPKKLYDTEDGLPNSDEELRMNPKYPHIPKPEKGITVVNKDGWDEKTMEFHLGYCAQMVGKLENIEHAVFCECFLSKIQYYYEPIYFKEAYQDQTLWNQYCLKKAGI